MPDVLSHTERVRKYALFLAKKEHADEEMVEIAAILHDIGYCIEGFKDHSKNSVIIAKEFLGKFNLPKTEEIPSVINHHGKEPKSLEEKIIMDADALDRIGCLGFFRMMIHFYRDEKIVDTEKLIEKSKEIVEKSIKNLSTNSAKEIAKSKILNLNKFFETLNIQLEPNLNRLLE